MTFKKSELKAIAALVSKNQDSAKLQKISNLSYLESIDLRNKLNDLIEEKEREEYKVSEYEKYTLEIEGKIIHICDNENNDHYFIDSTLMTKNYSFSKGVIPKEFYIEEIQNNIHHGSTREIEILSSLGEHYLFIDMSTAKITYKKLDIKLFNSYCSKLIEAHKEYLSKCSQFKRDFIEVNTMALFRCEEPIVSDISILDDEYFLNEEKNKLFFDSHVGLCYIQRNIDEETLSLITPEISVEGINLENSRYYLNIIIDIKTEDRVKSFIRNSLLELEQKKRKYQMISEIITISNLWDEYGYDDFPIDDFPINESLLEYIIDIYSKPYEEIRDTYCNLINWVDAKGEL